MDSVLNNLRNQTIKGTGEYMAPEIFMGHSYYGHTVDLFAAGVLLFGMVMGNMPFFKATPDDPYYKAIAANRKDLFWKTHLSKVDSSFTISESLVDLISLMLGYFYMERPWISEVKTHPWCLEEAATHKEVIQEFNDRFDMLRAEAETNADECIIPEDNFDQVTQEGIHRGVDSGDSDGFELSGMMDYIPEYTRKTSFWSTSDPEVLLKVLIEFWLKNTSSLVLLKEQYTVKFKIGYSLFAAEAAKQKKKKTSSRPADADRKVSILVRVLKFKEQEKYWVEAVPEKGDRVLFNRTFALLKTFFGGHVNWTAVE